MDPEHLALLTDAFDLGIPLSIEEDHEGVLNRNFDLVTEQGRYFVKAVRDRRKDSIPVIAAVEAFMADGGIPAVAMLRTKEGALFLPHEGEVYTVYPYIPHAKPAAIPYEALGSMLGRIHLRGNEPLPSILESILMTEKDAARVAEKLQAYRTRAEEGKDPVDPAFLEYIDRKLALLSHLPSSAHGDLTLVHGDYHAGNVLFDEDGSIIGICDWEKAERAPRAYEVARSIQYICFKGRGGGVVGIDAALAGSRELLAGYRAAFPIGDDELRDGFALRVRKLVMSFWIEERWYDHEDDRANKFIGNESGLIAAFTDPALIEAILA